MTPIFDDNSEFLKYLKEQKTSDTPKSPKNSADTKSDADGSTSNSAYTPNPDAQNQDFYLLNLKNHQISAPTLTEEVPVKKNNFKSPQKPVARPKSAPPSNTFSAFLLDKIKFLAISAFIFILTFGILNYQAYSLLFNNWWQDLRHSANSSPLNQLSVTTNDNQKLENTFEYFDNTDIPKLDLDITPPGTRIVIPRLRANVPIIGMSTSTLITRNWNALEKEMQLALRNGVVHYPGTPFPNQSGNIVLTGHSSYYPWDPGRFKDVFAVLHQAKSGDEIIVYYNQKKYHYQVTEIKKVMPTEVNVLGDTGDNRLTLITCTPIGTNLKRLIVVAKPLPTS